MKNGLLRKGLAGMLTVMLVAGLLLGVGSKPMEAQAKSSTPKQEREVKDINLKDTDGNIPGISDPEEPKDANSEWKGSKVYFGYGSFDTMSTEFRVLDAHTTDYNSSRPTMFLNLDRGIYAGESFSYSSKNSKAWSESELKTWMNSKEGSGFLSKWSEIEQDAIAESTRKEAVGDGKGADDLGWCALESDKVFALDAKEATNPSYGYSNSNGEVASRIKKNNGNLIKWWTRSPANEGNKIGIVSKVGSITSVESNVVAADGTGKENLTASPAFNLDLEPILFASADPSESLEDKNNYAEGDIKRPQDNQQRAVVAKVGSSGNYAGKNEWKLTLLDESKKLTLGTGIQKGDTVTVPYTYKGSSNGLFGEDQISVMITDGEYNSKTAMVLYYGQMTTEPLSTKEGEGTGTFTMPQNLPGTAKVYLLLEYLSGSNRTDYASKPVLLHIHNWSSDWSSDDTHHWHECLAADCPITDKSKKDGYGEHQENNGVVTKEPTYGQAGVKTYSCKTCGHVIRTETLEAIPSMPKVKASTTYKSVKLSWKAVKGTDGYQVYRATKKNGSYKKVKTTASKSWTNKNLTTGKTYYYKVRTYKKENGKTTYGGFSKTVKAVPRTKAPGFKLTAGNNKMKVKWNKVSGADGYKIYRAKSKNGKYQMVKDSRSRLRTYTSTGLSDHHTYYYKMRSYKVVKGKKVYSAYTNVKSKRTK